MKSLYVDGMKMSCHHWTKLLLVSLVFEYILFVYLERLYLIILKSHFSIFRLCIGKVESNRSFIYREHDVHIFVAFNAVCPLPL